MEYNNEKRKEIPTSKLKNNNNNKNTNNELMIIKSQRRILESKHFPCPFQEKPYELQTGTRQFITPYDSFLSKLEKFIM